MIGAKECTTRISSTQSLHFHDGSPPTDANKFRLVIGALQYLSLTCPGISYATNKLAQFMHSPIATPWSATKRLLRYLKNTICHGLFLKRHQELNVSTFTDAD